MGKRSPVLGYNHNFKHRGLIFHVQTEDSGVDNPHLFTHLFHGGVIISSRRTDYDAASEVDLVKGLMQSQHKAVAKGLSSGSFDDKIDAYLGNRDDLEPRKAGSLGSSAEITAQADRRSKASPKAAAVAVRQTPVASDFDDGSSTDVVRIPPELAMEAEHAQAMEAESASQAVAAMQASQAMTSDRAAAASASPTQAAIQDAVTARDIPRMPDAFATGAPPSAGVFENREAPARASDYADVRGDLPAIGDQERTLEDVTAAAHAAAAEARDLAAQAEAEVAHARQLQAAAAAATARAHELEATARARSHSDSSAHSGAISLGSPSSSSTSPSTSALSGSAFGAAPSTAHVARSSKSMEADMPHKRKHLPTAVEMPAYEDNLGDPTVTFSTGGSAASKASSTEAVSFQSSDAGRSQAAPSGRSQAAPSQAGRSQAAPSQAAPSGRSQAAPSQAAPSHPEAVPEAVTGEYSGTYSMKRLPQESTQRVGRRRASTSAREAAPAPSRARTTTNRPSGKAGNPEPGRPRSPVVVSRPAVIIGAPPKMVGKKPRRKARSGVGSVFGKDLISEKSLDEVIMAYLSEDGSEE